MFLSVFEIYEPVRSLHFNNLEQMLLASGVGKRLLVACLLGGAIGMEREYHKKSLGLRTNLLISFSVLGTQGQHRALMATLRASPGIDQLHTYHDAEDE
jgi:MgtC family